MVRLPCTVYVLVTCSNPLKIRLRRLRRLRPVAAGCGRLRAVASGCKRLRPVASGCKRLQTPPARDLGFECLMCDDSTPSSLPAGAAAGQAHRAPLWRGARRGREARVFAAVHESTLCDEWC